MTPKGRLTRKGQDCHQPQKGSIMGDVFRQKIIRYVDAEGRRVRKGAEGARAVEERSRKWYGEYRDADGNLQRVPLSSDKTAARQMLAQLEREAELTRRGLADPKREADARRPLLEHLNAFEAALRAEGATPAHVEQTVSCCRRVLAECRFDVPADGQAGSVQEFLSRLKGSGRNLQPLEKDKETWTKAELARALGVKPSAIPPLVKRHHL